MGDKTKISAYRELTNGGRLIEMLLCKWTQEGDLKTFVSMEDVYLRYKVKNVMAFKSGLYRYSQARWHRTCFYSTCP